MIIIHLYKNGTIMNYLDCCKILRNRVFSHAFWIGKFDFLLLLFLSCYASMYCLSISLTLSHSLSISLAIPLSLSIYLYYSLDITLSIYLSLFSWSSTYTPFGLPPLSFSLSLFPFVNPFIRICMFHFRVFINRFIMIHTSQSLCYSQWCFASGI